MRRRDFVKAMAAVSVTAKTMLGQQAAPPATPTAPAPPPPGPVPWMRGLAEVKPLPVSPVVPDAIAEANASFFTARQMATLRKLGETLLPPLKGYPGAVEAGAPEFLDFLIGVSPADRQQAYQAGLDRLETEAKKQFGISFEAVNAAQADQLIRPWLRAWMSDHPPAEPYAYFINIAHNDIREATINSQAWNEAALADGVKNPGMGLYWFPVEPDIHHEGPASAVQPVAHKSKGHPSRT